MPRQITIDPVTRIEGHAKITVFLDDEGKVNDAQFHVTQLRGFEKLCEGRPFHEMPSIMARICGICPVSHLVASSKACDELMSVRIPPTAANLRRMLNLAQVVQSHALSFFYLSSPDLLLGMDADPATRSLVGVMMTDPQLGRDGIALRKFGQQMIELLGNKRIHPSWVVPGGVNQPLSADHREQILAQIPEVRRIALRVIKWFKGTLEGFTKEIETFGTCPTLHMGLVNKNAELEHYDGWLRIVDSKGEIIGLYPDPTDYHEYLGEAVEKFSFLKSTYFKPMGYPDGIYRVGPLARLNIVERCGTPLADEEFKEFQKLERPVVQSSFHYHYARLIEILYCIEKIEMILNEPDILSTHVRAFAKPNQQEGIGVSEAPRGTLLHHYKIDENGLIIFVNLIIATGHNNLAMNRGVLQVAKDQIDGQEIREGMLNRVEAVIRTFDPCLSCSTHALGKMPLHIALQDSGGRVIHELKRD
ncbi:MAG: Ni/Fe hydrogenase subunit alpha [Armatimonadota bacterium]|nr:Ni/Fe hydrogenase subunit alpha [Armatimonadota bacterium]